jgi:hypothetical protein
MTEEEMKTKWCPHTKMAVTDEDGRNPTTVSVNRTGIRGTSEFGLPHACMCIASACSQWRWKKVANPDYNPSSMMGVYPQPWPTPPMFIDSDKHGYCGLAGQP